MAGKVDKISTFVDDYLARGIFPAASFVLLDGDFASDEQVFGACQAGQYWDLASVSKVVGVGDKLIRKIFAGEIALDAPLAAYLPTWQGAAVTVRELLTHHSGLNPYIPNRESLDAEGLTQAILRLDSFPEKEFRYTDVNFILLGFMLEKLENKPLDAQFGHYGPVENAVPTRLDAPSGVVHDPKARILGNHCGSAGLFSTASELTAFVKSYFVWPDAVKRLTQNYSPEGSPKARSLAWDLTHDDWLLHTGYTGTFILMNLKRRQAVIFLSNRTFYKDERAQWILDRDVLIDKIIKCL